MTFTAIDNVKLLPVTTVHVLGFVGWSQTPPFTLSDISGGPDGVGTGVCVEVGIAVGPVGVGVGVNVGSAWQLISSELGFESSSTAPPLGMVRRPIVAPPMLLGHVRSRTMMVPMKLLNGAVFRSPDVTDWMLTRPSLPVGADGNRMVTAASGQTTSSTCSPRGL